MPFRSISADRSGIKYRWATRGGNLPHGDPKLARMGVRQTSRAWAGYSTTQVTAEEEGLLEPLWGESMAAEAAAGAETAVVTAEDAAVMTSIMEGGVLTIGWEFVLAAAAVTAVVGFVAHEISEHSKGKKRSPTSVLPETPDQKRFKGITHPGWTGTNSVKRHLDFGHPVASPEPKRPKPNPNEKTNPFAAPGDFSGLVTTFVNPTTSRIIGYKGIPRKHRYAALMASSEFWRNQMTPSRQLFSTA